ncbi:hypothetical protein CsSME_00006180 [Camellia sinensis var. sinensis]
MVSHRQPPPLQRLRLGRPRQLLRLCLTHDRNPVEGLSASPFPIELASAWGVVSASSNIEADAAALGRFSSFSSEHSLKIVYLIFKRVNFLVSVARFSLPFPRRR